MKQNTQIKHASKDDIIDVFRTTQKPQFIIRKNNKKRSKFCYACGHADGFKFLNIINNDLSSAWGLSRGLRKSFDIRESSKCENCGSSLRSSIHARTICSIYAPKAKCLTEAIKDPSFRKLKIAESNGALHKLLISHPGLSYSEYVPDDKSIRHESLDKLTYKSGMFDLVLTSETLEHLPDWELALKEIRRVLKDGGRHVFTTPAILSRQTRTRAKRKNGKIVHMLPAAYHGYNRGNPDDYTVFNEFGADLRKEIDKLGYSTDLYYRNVVHLSDPNFAYVSTKV